MRDFTRQGVAPDPNWPLAPDPNWLRAPNPRRSIEPEPVFQLTRRARSESAIPTTMGWPSVLEEAEARAYPAEAYQAEARVDEARVDEARVDEEVEEVTDLDDDERIHVPATRRQIAVRVVGLLAIAAAIFGAYIVLRSPDAFRQALDWATLGHADAILQATP